jgi:hypothetical protein
MGVVTAREPGTAPHRLRLSAGEYAYLVDRLELTMPPGWEPAPDARTGAEPAGLADRGVLRGAGDLVAVHPSVTVNLGILAAPAVLLDTTATVAGSAVRGLHALAGSLPLGASLFALDGGGVELSLFGALDLGRELARAVPAGENDWDYQHEKERAGSAISSRLDFGYWEEPPRGVLPLAALRDLGEAELLRGADSGAPAAVLRELRLPQQEAELASRVASRTDGTLLAQITARAGGTVRAGYVTWLHTGAGWTGLRPAPRRAGVRMVSLEPVARADLGVWAAPYIAEALSDD